MEKDDVLRIKALNTNIKYCKIISINSLLTKFISSLTNSLIDDFFFHVEGQF